MCNCGQSSLKQRFRETKNRILKLYGNSQLQEKKITVIKINKM
jgi:hypothetical protein